MERESQSEEKITQGTPVIVDGTYLGWDFKQLDLKELQNFDSDVEEVYIKTGDNDVYLLRKEDGEREQQVKIKLYSHVYGESRVSLRDVQIPREDLNDVLSIGGSMRYSRFGKLEDIAEMLVIDSKQDYTPDQLEFITKGISSDLRQRFWAPLRH